MHATKLKFMHQLTRTIRELFSVVFNIQTDDQLEKIFGITDDKLESVSEKIVDALPENIFTDDSSKALDEIKNICAREFVFFQAQENCHDQNYEEDLLNFINVFTRDIHDKFSNPISINNLSVSNLKEE